MERQRLNGIAELFPGKSVVIGKSSVLIKPLNLAQISNLVKISQGLGKKFAELGITLDNFNTPANIFKIAGFLVVDAPELLEEATNVYREDITQLPLDAIVELVSVVIDVNLESKDSLVKNFSSLIKFLPMEEAEKPPMNQTAQN